VRGEEQELSFVGVVVVVVVVVVMVMAVVLAVPGTRLVTIYLVQKRSERNK